ncbi:hypothetical protein RUM43_014075 [Polyplax serrata]|uniref:tRNA pseudouridine synthase n=1 Tax=Polyplax serrata TaxID=468196 RepID=A0AAN8P576_POLSC
MSVTQRTDSGVHALRAGAQIDLPPFRTKFISPESIQTLLNVWLTKEAKNLRILEVTQVPDIFNVKYSTIEKVYMYRVAIAKPENKVKYIAPISEVYRTLFLSENNFCPEKVQKATELLVGEKDFASFIGRFSKNKRHSICKISSFVFEKSQPFMANNDALSDMFNYYQFTCFGNRFLYKMMRRMVGVLLSTGCDKIRIEDIHHMFNHPAPTSWPCRAFVAPAYGLYLANVFYNPDHLVITNEEMEAKLNLIQIKTAANSQSLVQNNEHNYYGLKMFDKKIENICAQLNTELEAL